MIVERLGKAATKRSRSREANRLTVSARTAFLNIPYDHEFEESFLAFIAGLCGFGLIPHATIEITGSERRLDRINRLIRRCRYSFHDLSRVQLDRNRPATPRFNMPFELGLAVACAKHQRVTHNWFVFEAQAHRLKKLLSDLDGTDPYIHDANPRGVLRALANALSRAKNPPTLSELSAIYEDLTKAARAIKSELDGGSLFEARPFKELVILAGMSARERIASLR
jgi:hypothetical protein